MSAKKVNLLCTSGIGIFYFGKKIRRDEPKVPGFGYRVVQQTLKIPWESNLSNQIVMANMQEIHNKGWVLP